MYSTDGILTFSFPLGQWLGARVRVSFLLPVLLLAMMWRLQDLPWGMVAGILLLYSLLLHELAHLIERHHNDRFLAIMDRVMPTWRMNREDLNRSPLAHQEWSY